MLIARWESRTRKHWVEVRREEDGYGFTSPGASGYGYATEAQIMAETQRKVDMGGYFQPDAAKTTMQRVYYRVAASSLEG